MDYSVIILSFNSERYIEKCLNNAIDAFTELKSSYEIYVIDNGSTDNSLSLIDNVKTERDAPIHVIAFPHNTGTTFSRNQGLRLCSGQHIIILDSDAYVNPQAIEKLSNNLLENEQCGLICPKLTYPDGRFQISVDTFPTFFRKLKRFFFLKKMEASSREPENKLTAVNYAISAFWMLPQKTLEAVGLMDEKIFYSPEDVDYCIRVWKAGFNILYDPSVSVIHDAQEISRSKGFKINRFTISHIKGLCYLFLKHRYFFSGKKFLTGAPNNAY